MTNETDEVEIDEFQAKHDELVSIVEDLINSLDTIGKLLPSQHRFQFSIPGAADFEDAMATPEEWRNLLDSNFEDLEVHEKNLYLRFHIFMVYKSASIQPRLISYRYSAFHVLSSFAKDAAFQLKNNNFLLAFSALRGLIETIGHFCHTVSKLENYIKNEEEPTPAFEEPYWDYLAYLFSLGNLVSPEINSSRYNWDRAFEAKTFLMTEKQRRKKTQKEKANLSLDSEPISIMTSIDRLDKTVKGTRSAYDLLCEFVHPNSAQRELYVGLTKTKKIKGVGLSVNFYGPSDAEIRENVFFRLAMLSQIILCIGDLAAAFLKQDAQLRKLQNQLKKHTQQFTRQAIKSLLIFSHSDPCPCGSSKTIQNCCGKRLRSSLIDSKSREAMLAAS